MAQRNHPGWMESLYDKLANDQDGRVCEAISDQACREAPGNFFRTAVANTLTSIGDRMASAKTTLPWLLSHLAAPAWCISLLVPIRESGSMLPQLAIGALVRQQPIRKWVWSAGSSAMLVGAGLAWFSQTEQSVVFAIILFGGAALWFVAAAVYATIVEFPGETGGGINGLQESFNKLALLWKDPPFCKFVIARALAMGSGLAAPFYVTLAREDLGHAAAYLGVFIAVEGLAALVSAPVWGYFSDRSSRLVFASACGLASLLSLAVAIWSLSDLAPGLSRWFYPVAFFGLGIAHAGVRLGRKTYLVDLAEGNRRTDYVAVSNTVIGALLLASGLIGAAAAAFSVEAAILLLAIAGLIGSALSLTWKAVS